MGETIKKDPKAVKAMMIDVSPVKTSDVKIAIRDVKQIGQTLEFDEETHATKKNDRDLALDDDEVTTFYRYDEDNMPENKINEHKFTEKLKTELDAASKTFHVGVQEDTVKKGKAKVNAKVLHDPKTTQLMKWVEHHFSFNSICDAYEQIDCIEKDFFGGEITQFNYVLKDFDERQADEQERLKTMKKVREKKKITRLDQEIVIKDDKPAMTKAERKDFKKEQRKNHENLCRQMCNVFKHLHPIMNMCTNTGRM